MTASRIIRMAFPIQTIACCLAFSDPCPAGPPLSPAEVARISEKIRRYEIQRLAPRSAAIDAVRPADTQAGSHRDQCLHPTVANALAASDAHAADSDYAALHLGIIESLPQDKSPPLSASQPASADADRDARDRHWNRRRPLPRFLDTLERDLKELPGDLWHDTKNVYGRPINLVILGASYGGALALQEAGPDDTVERHFDNSNVFKRDWRDVFATAGNPAVHFALAGVWYLAGQQTQNDDTYQVGRTLFSALAINGLTVMAGQLATSDDAPNGQWGTFPSGHTSSSFCFASVMHEAYGPVAGIPLYGLAALVGVERLDSQEHYFSDVVFGAIMGTLIGHSVASGHDPEVFGFKVVPYADPYEGGAGIALYKAF